MGTGPVTGTDLFSCTTYYIRGHQELEEVCRKLHGDPEGRMTHERRLECGMRVEEGEFTMVTKDKGDFGRFLSWARGDGKTEMSCQGEDTFLMSVQEGVGEWIGTGKRERGRSS